MKLGSNKEFVVDVIWKNDTDKFLFEMSQRLDEVIISVQDLNEQIDFWMKEAECIKHELASYDPDLDEPDLNGKEEFDRAVEGGDTDGTLP
jgi:hypothetical protein